MQNNNDNRYLKKNGKTVKKQYVAKKNTRSSYKEPNVKEKLLSKKFIIFLIIIFIATIITSVYNHTYMQISDIYISGNKSINDEEIIAQLDNPIGKNIILYQVRDSEQRIKSSNNIDDVSIKKVFPNLLSISVDESYPLYYQQADNKTYIISNKGKIISDNDQNTEGLIEISGAKLRKIIGENFTSSEASLNFIKAVQEYSYANEIKYIDLENKADIGIMINDIDVKFGDLNNISNKLKLLDQILDDIRLKGIKVNQIDLDNGNNPVVKVDNESFSENLNY